MTNRVFLAWLAWIKQDRNIPSRADAYAMQIAAEVRRGWVSKPESVSTDSFRIEFEDVTESKPKDAPPMSDEEAEALGFPSTSLAKNQAAMARAMWISRMTMPPVIQGNGNQ